MKRFFVSIVYLFILSISSARTPGMYAAKPGYFVDKVHLKGKQLYAYVRVAGASSTLWFRTVYNKVSTSDKAVATISFAKKTVEEMEKTFCEGYTAYDDAKTITACAASVGTVFCAAEMPVAAATGMAPVVEECEMKWEEAYSSGEIAECVQGIAEGVSKVITGSDEFGEYSLQEHFVTGQSEKVGGDAIKEWCKDIKHESERDEKHPAHALGPVFKDSKAHHGAVPGNDGPPGRAGTVPPPPGNPHPPFITHPPSAPPSGPPSAPPSGPPSGNAGNPDGVGDDYGPPDDPDNDWEGEGGHLIIGHPKSQLLMDFHTLNTEQKNELVTQLSANPSGSKSKPIPDSIVIKKNTARLIAKAYLIKTYGAQNIEQQNPYTQNYFKGYWILSGSATGTPPKPGFKIVIDAATGEIIDVAN